MNRLRQSVARILVSVSIPAVALFCVLSPNEASAQSLTVGNCEGITSSFFANEPVCVSGTTGGTPDSDDALACVLPSTGGTKLDDVTPDGCNAFPPESTMTNEPIWLELDYL